MKVYGWSAYSQGSGDNRYGDADASMSRALKFFGHDIDAKPITDPVERGRTLGPAAAHPAGAGRDRAIAGSTHLNEGRLKDRGLQILITQLGGVGVAEGHQSRAG